jgi:hypothetical protein
VSAVQEIYRFSTAERIALALEGPREVRSFLIGDQNEDVAQAVLRNPRLTLTEIKAICEMKHVSREVLRSVGSHPDWSKLDVVRYHLLFNPNTPLELAVGFVSVLKSMRLRLLALANDPNVRKPIRDEAQRLLRGSSDGGEAAGAPIPPPTGPKGPLPSPSVAADLTNEE